MADDAEVVAGSGGSSLAANNDATVDEAGSGGTVAAVVIVLVLLCLVGLAVYIRRARSRNSTSSSGGGNNVAMTSPAMTYGLAPREGAAGGRGRSASRSRSRGASMRGPKEADTADLYGTLELAKGSPMTYGAGVPQEAQSTYGNLTVGPAAPTYAVASSYASTARQERATTASNLYAPVGGEGDTAGRYGTVTVGPAPPVASRSHAYRTTTSNSYDTASTATGERYGTVSIGPARPRYDTASSVASPNAVYTAPDVAAAPSNALYTAPTGERPGAPNHTGPYTRV